MCMYITLTFSCRAAKVPIRSSGSSQGERVPGITTEDQEEHLGPQQARRAAVDHAVYVHGLR